MVPEQEGQSTYSDGNQVQATVHIARQAQRDEAGLRSSQEVKIMCQNQGLYQPGTGTARAQIRQGPYMKASAEKLRLSKEYMHHI